MLHYSEAKKGLPSYVGALAVTTSIQMVATTAVLVLGAIAPIVADEIGISAAAVGFQVSLIYFAGIFTSAIAGSLIATFGPVRIEQVTLFGAAAGFLGIGLGHLTTIIAGSIAIGIGYGLNNPASSAILVRATPPHRRNLVFSIKQAGVPLGGFIASLVIPWLAGAAGWRIPLCALFAGTMIGGVAIGRHPVEWDRRVTTVLRGMLAEQTILWRHRGLTSLALTGMLFSGAQLSLGAFTIQLLVHECGWTLIGAGAVAAAMQGAGAVGRIAWGWLADRTGRGLQCLAFIGAVSALVGLAFPLLDRLPMAAQTVMLVVLGFCSIGWNGVLLAETSRLAPPGQEGAMVGAMLVFTFIGVAVLPACLSLAFAVLPSFRILLAVLSVPMLLGTILCLTANRTRLRGLAIAG